MSIWMSKNISANEAGAGAIYGGPMVAEADVTVLANGNIVVAQIAATDESDPYARRIAELDLDYDVPFRDRYDISYEGSTVYKVALSVFSPTGQLIKRVDFAETGQLMDVNILPREDGFDVEVRRWWHERDDDDTVWDTTQSELIFKSFDSNGKAIRTETTEADSAPSLEKALPTSDGGYVKARLVSDSDWQEFKDAVDPFGIFHNNREDHDYWIEVVKLDENREEVFDVEIDTGSTTDWWHKNSALIDMISLPGGNVVVAYTDEAFNAGFAVVSPDGDVIEQVARPGDAPRIHEAGSGFHFQYTSPNGDRTIVTYDSEGTFQSVRAVTGEGMAISPNSLRGGNMLQDGRTVEVEVVDGEAILTINETRGDVIEGTANGEDIYARQEGGTLYGLGGNDWMVGYGGDDTLYGGNENDSLYGQGGRDLLVGGMGHDNMSGGSGNDVFLYEGVHRENNHGNDTINGGEGFDFIKIAAASDITHFDLSKVEFTGVERIDMIASEEVEHFNLTLRADQLAGVSYIHDSSLAANETVGIYLGEAADFSGGELLVVGTAGAGRPKIEIAGDLRDNAITGTTQANYIHGLWGEDTLNGSQGDDTLHGGRGTDQVFGGDGHDRIYGEEGYDTLKGGAGNDRIYGQEGNDFIEGGAGRDTLDGGADIDVLSFVGSEEDVSVNLATSTISTGDVIRNFESVWAGSGDDHIVGNSGANEIRGHGGADTIEGGAGSDIIDAGAGNDVVRGGGGRDVLYGGQGYDTLLTTEWNGVYEVDLTTGETNWDGEWAIGFEAIETGNGTDRILGTEGTNEITTNGGADFVDGRGGGDTIRGGGGNDTLNGGEGSDVIQGGGGRDVMDGGAGYDWLLTTEWNGGSYNLNMETGETNWSGETAINFEAIETGNGSDHITGTSGWNEIVTNGGHDTVRAGGGEDTVDGGAGNDVLYGGADNDILKGGDNADRLYGDAGNDTLLGGRGDDTVYSGGGQDVMDGGPGSDTFDDADWNGGWEIDLAAGTTNHGEQLLYFENVVLGGGNDRVLGSSESNTLRTGGGYDWLEGRAGADLLLGQGGGDTLWGGAHNDTLDGGTGHDLLQGEHGDDVLRGGTGEDALAGGSGNDILEGGAGADIFYFSDGNEGADVIRDFETGIDKIDLKFAGIRGLDELEITESGAGVSLDLGETEVLLEGLSAADVDQIDFQFA